MLVRQLAPRAVAATRRQHLRPPNAPWALVVLLLLTIASCQGPVQVRAQALDGRQVFGVPGDYESVQTPPGLSPRYFLEGVPGIARRDDGGGCAAGFHSCLDINSTLCCANDRYCLIDPTTSAAACCAIGLTCGSPCNETQYECNATTTLTQTKTSTESRTTTTIAGTATLPPPVAVTATVTTTSVFLACCARRCPGTSMFACASSFGGGCCSFGQTCASSSQCIWTASSGDAGITPASGTGIVSAAQPSGCTTSQIACPSSLGGGCCDLGHTCTVVSSQVFCASASATTSGLTTASGDGGGGLSGGAKAGIAVGVVVGAALLLGAATWACMRQRRIVRQRRESLSLPPPPPVSLQDGSGASGYYDNPHPQRQYTEDGGGGDLRAPPPLHNAQLVDGAMSSPAMSQVQAAAAVPAGRHSWLRPLRFRRNTGSTEAAGGAGTAGAGSGGAPSGAGPPLTESDETSRRGGLPGLTRDYFGPDAVPGPYTEPVNYYEADGGNGVVSPLELGGLETGGGAAQTAQHSVPMQPQGPHDIVAPVEIDSAAKVEMADNEKAEPGEPYPEATPLPSSGTYPPASYQAGPIQYELYGSEVPTPQAEVESPVRPNENLAPNVPVEAPGQPATPASQAESPAHVVHNPPPFTTPPPPVPE